MTLSKQQAIEGLKVKVVGGKRYAGYGEGILGPVVNAESFYRDVVLDSGRVLHFNLENLTEVHQYSASGARSLGPRGPRAQLALAPDAISGLVKIFQNDPNFKMPISAPPDQENAVIDEIPSAEEGLTIATGQKLYTSYDVVYTTDAQVDALLAGSGGHSEPWFDSDHLSFFNGPRKAFYNTLLDAGCKPTRLGA